MLVTPIGKADEVAPAIAVPVEMPELAVQRMHRRRAGLAVIVVETVADADQSHARRRLLPSVGQ